MEERVRHLHLFSTSLSLQVTGISCGPQEGLRALALDLNEQGL